MKMNASIPLTRHGRCRCSRWQGENYFQRPGKSKADFCSLTIEFHENIQRLFPLPPGEGQGEGKQVIAGQFS